MNSKCFCMTIYWILLFLIVELSFAQYSTTFIGTSAPVESWYSIASSSSGQYLAAVTNTGSYGGLMYTSDNYGYDWNLTSAPKYPTWTSIASSSSGQYLCATQNDGGIFTSADYGGNWTQTSAADPSSWVSITSDSTGQYLAAAVSFSGIWTSNDYGVNWTFAYAGADVYWKSVASSSSGQFLFAAAGGVVGRIYKSADYGGNWSVASALPQDWYAIASDASGQSVFAVVFGGGIYISNDYGALWDITSAPSNDWTSVSSDDSGQCLFATADNGFIYYSLDYGSTWSQADAPIIQWSSVASSNDCQYVAAAAFESGIYANLYAPTSFPSSLPSSKPSTTPMPTTPTSQPTSLPSSVPILFPTSQPSTVPSILPSGLPSGTPTSQPSTSPTSNPTLSSNSFVVNGLVESTTAQSSYVFESIGCGSIAYLSATIEVSYLDASSGGYINITAGSGESAVNVTSQCAPSTSCGSVSCAVNVDITTALSCQNGGQLTVYADTVHAQDATGSDTLCSYKGDSQLQYALSYTLSATPLPTGVPTLAPVLVNEPVVFQASPNAPFYVIAAIALLFIALGVILVRAIDRNPEAFVEISLLATCIDLAMIGYHISSELFYIIVLFSEGLASLGIVIILTRLCSVIPASYFIAVTLGPTKYSLYYSKLLNQSHLFKNAPTFSVVIVLMMFEQSMVRYFPWSANNFSKLSRGFPDQHLFQVCMIPKLLQLMITIIVQIVVLASVDANILYGGSNPIAATLVVMYLISSILLFVMFSVTNAIRMVVAVEKHNNADVETIEDGKGHTNPIHSVEGVGRGAELIQTVRMDGTGDFKSRFEYLEEREKLLTAEVRELRELVMSGIGKAASGDVGQL